MPKPLAESMSNPRLSASARVALFLLHRTSHKGGFSYLSSAELGAMLGLTNVRVSQIARELADAELVRREYARDRTGRKRWVLLPGLLAAIAIAGAPLQPDAGTIAERPTATFHFPATKKPPKQRSRKRPAA